MSKSYRISTVSGRNDTDLADSPVAGCRKELSSTLRRISAEGAKGEK